MKWQSENSDSARWNNTYKNFYTLDFTSDWTSVWFSITASLEMAEEPVIARPKFSMHKKVF